MVEGGENKKERGLNKGCQYQDTTFLPNYQEKIVKILLKKGNRERLFRFHSWADKDFNKILTKL